MGLKLDFPKHCIPSHFTHHCGLQTRIESPVKSASDSGCCSHWKIGQMSVFWMYLKSESFNLPVVFCETAQFMLICYYHNAILAIKKFPLYSFAPTLQVISTPLFPPPSNCLSLRGLLEPMHLTQMKEKPGIRDISVDSGTVCSVDPLLRSSYFENSAEFMGLKNRKAQTFEGKKNKKRSLLSSLNQQAFFGKCELFLFIVIYSISTFFLINLPVTDTKDQSN